MGVNESWLNMETLLYEGNEHIQIKCFFLFTKLIYLAFFLYIDEWIRSIWSWNILDEIDQQQKKQYILNKKNKNKNKENGVKD